MKSVYGAPVTGVPLSDVEYHRICQLREPYSREGMTRLLLELTPDELRLRSCTNASASEYDYTAFRAESRIFVPGNRVHVLRHLRYDHHEPHAHDYFEMICQIFGRGTAEISGKKLELTPGMVCILSPGTIHRLEANADDGVILKVILRESDFEEHSKQLLRADPVLTGFFREALRGSAGFMLYDGAGDGGLQDILLRMRYYEVRRDLTDYLMKEALLLELFCCLVSEHLGSVRTSFTDQLDTRLLMRIREDYRSITLEDLSREFHFTQNYINRILRKMTGQSFGSLVLSLKIEHACRLLEDGQRPISEIAAEVGFESKAFFNKKFKAHTGMTPTAYRKSVC